MISKTYDKMNCVTWYKVKQKNAFAMEKENLTKEFIRDLSKILSDSELGKTKKISEIQDVFSRFLISFYSV